jgi:hypothetical protein
VREQWVEFTGEMFASIKRKIPVVAQGAVNSITAIPQHIAAITEPAGALPRRRLLHHQVPTAPRTKPPTSRDAARFARQRSL